MSRADPPEEEEEGGLFARWSRRKRAARAPVPEAPPQAGSPPTEALQAEPLEAPAELQAADPVAPAAPEPLELPSLDSLGPGADLRPFLRPGVPAALRSAALRRVWSTDPAIRDYIGPADYAWDWNTPGGVPDYSETLGVSAERIEAEVRRMFACLDPPKPAEPEPTREADSEPVPPASEVAAEPAPLVSLDAPPPVPGPSVRLGPLPESRAAELAPPEPLPAEPERDEEVPAPRPRHGRAMPVLPPQG